MLSVTVNPDDEASASDYETTRDSWKSIQNLLLQLSRYKGKLALAAIYHRRARVVGHSIAAGAPPLTHVCTVGAGGTRPRRGPPAALPGQACGGMLGAMVYIALRRVVVPLRVARFFIDSPSRFEKGIGLKSGSSPPRTNTRTHNFALGVAAVSSGSPLYCSVF